MKKKFLIPSSLAVIAVIVIYLLFFNSSNAGTQKFTFTQITKGDLSTTITSTGTLQAVTTVDVGTQVSGKIDKILVDFNSNVERDSFLRSLIRLTSPCRSATPVTALRKHKRNMIWLKPSLTGISHYLIKNFFQNWIMQRQNLIIRLRKLILLQHRLLWVRQKRTWVTLTFILL